MPYIPLLFSLYLGELETLLGGGFRGDPLPTPCSTFDCDTSVC